MTADSMHVKRAPTRHSRWFTRRLPRAAIASDADLVKIVAIKRGSGFFAGTYKGRRLEQLQPKRCAPVRCANHLAFAVVAGQPRAVLRMNST